jgi:hypothetical protein
MGGSLLFQRSTHGPAWWLEMKYLVVIEQAATAVTLELAV